jgi:O-6-methylguanine DNA methyltransferase
VHVRYTLVDCTLGRLLVAATGRGVCAVMLGDADADLRHRLAEQLPDATLSRDGAALAAWAEAIVAHLEGRGEPLDLPLDIRATAFQRRVWQAVQAIPWGETRTYSEVAAQIGRPEAVRAVARACAQNPVALVVPCHRVVRKDGELGGYRWGLERKAELLRREAAETGHGNSRQSTVVAMLIVGLLLPLLMGAVWRAPGAALAAMSPRSTDARPAAALTSTGYLPVVVRAAAPVWQPMPGTSWQWQLSDLPVDTSVDAAMYDIDLFDNDASVVAALHAAGRKVVCYFSAGSWEEWRPDAHLFRAEVLGKDYVGWPGERWLDIRRLDQLAPIMRARLDLCRARGFDGVEPDNVDGYTNDTGFQLTYHDQLVYNRWLAMEAHRRGLSIGLKNDPAQVADLLAYFDWALTENCFAEGWCAEMTPFIAGGKAVFAAEYTDTGITTGDFCAPAAAMRFSAILKRRDLDAWRVTCP